MQKRTGFLRLLMSLTLAWFSYWGWSYNIAKSDAETSRQAIHFELDVLTRIIKSEPPPGRDRSVFEKNLDYQNRVVDEANADFQKNIEDRKAAQSWGILGVIALWIGAAFIWWIWSGFNIKRDDI